MGYKSMLVHLDTSRRCAERVDIASRLALDFGAHLVGLYVAEPRELRGGLASEAGAEFVAQRHAPQRELAQEASDMFRERTARAGLDRAEMRTAQGDPVRALALHARYADLLVIGQTDPDAEDNSARVRSELPDETVLSAGRPVLIVPYAGTYPRLGEHILVAWDASPQAARSVTAALTFLKNAKHVTVLVVNPGETNGHGDIPGADISLYLARHGAHVETEPSNVKGIDVATWLVSRTFELGADMIVMGGYGHSFVRERLFGGVTRSLLGQMTVPVLMGH